MKEKLIDIISGLIVAISIAVIAFVIYAAFAYEPVAFVISAFAVVLLCSVALAAWIYIFYVLYKCVRERIYSWWSGD